MDIVDHEGSLALDGFEGSGDGDDAKIEADPDAVDR